jgi:hypothetical protein
MVRCGLVLPAEFVAAALASSSASVADSAEKTAPYTDPALANTAASWWYTNSPAHADSKANTDPNSDTAAYPNPDSATNADSDAKADPDSSSYPDSPSGKPTPTPSYHNNEGHHSEGHNGEGHHKDTGTTHVYDPHKGEGENSGRRSTHVNSNTEHHPTPLKPRSSPTPPRTLKRHG